MLQDAIRRWQSSKATKQTRTCRCKTFKCCKMLKDHCARLLKYMYYPRPPASLVSSNRECFAHYKHISYFFNKDLMPLLSPTLPKNPNFNWLVHNLSMEIVYKDIFSSKRLKFICSLIKFWLIFTFLYCLLPKGNFNNISTARRQLVNQKVEVKKQSMT